MRKFIQKNGIVVSIYLLGACALWMAVMIVLPQVFMLDFSFRFNLPPSKIGGPEDVYTVSNYTYLIFGRANNPEGFNWLDTSVFAKQYDPACQLEFPEGTTAYGAAEAECLWLALRNALPDALFTIHHRIGMEEPLLPPRAALRWSLTGRHAGWRPFGPPSGAILHVMGMSHAEFGPQGLRREWTLFDTGAVWMQIAAQTG